MVKGGFQQDRDCACADPVTKEQNPEINAVGLYFDFFSGLKGTAFSVAWLHALFPLDLVLAQINEEDIHRDLGILDTLK